MPWLADDLCWPLFNNSLKPVLNGSIKIIQFQKKSINETLCVGKSCHNTSVSNARTGPPKTREQLWGHFNISRRPEERS